MFTLTVISKYIATLLVPVALVGCGNSIINLKNGQNDNLPSKDSNPRKEGQKQDNITKSDSHDLNTVKNGR